MRGWRNSVGNLIELLWLRETYHGLQFTGLCMKHRGYGFIEFDGIAVLAKANTTRTLQTESLFIKRKPTARTEVLQASLLIDWCEAARSHPTCDAGRASWTVPDTRPECGAGLAANLNVKRRRDIEGDIGRYRPRRSNDIEKRYLHDMQSGPRCLAESSIHAAQATQTRR